MWSHLQYQMQGCDAGRADIGETTRKLGTRLNEHQKSAEHANDAGHSIDWTSVKIIGQENHPQCIFSPKSHFFYARFSIY